MKIEYCYASYNGQGDMVAACGDHPEHKRDTAKFVAEEIRRGNRVERVTADVAGAGIKAYWAKLHPKAAA